MTAIPINEKIPVIKGLDLSNIKLQKNLNENKMLLVDIETSNICNLQCPYCFRDVYGTKMALRNELTLEERLKLIKQARELGCETIKITGAGEPTIDKYFFEMVEYANKLGMWVITFTNGFTINKELAERLFSMGISLIVKCNSLKPEIEDKIVGKPGYAKRRNQSIKCLVDAGFNKTMPTRLGFDSVITNLNKQEIIENLRFCRKNNIFPLFRPMMPIGGAINVKEWEISKQEIITIYEKAREADKEFGLDYSLVLPYMGGVWCRQLHYALYVNILGEVFACTGSRKLLGNVKEKPLKKIWDGPKTKRIRETPYDSCPLRENYWKGKKDYDCI